MVLRMKGKSQTIYLLKNGSFSNCHLKGFIIFKVASASILPVNIQVYVIQYFEGLNLLKSFPFYVIQAYPSKMLSKLIQDWRNFTLFPNTQMPWLHSALKSPIYGKSNFLVCMNFHKILADRICAQI